MPNCFVIMPFRPELTYLYRSLKSHITEAYPEVTVERGDDRALTGPVLKKIENFLSQADVVIADCSGRNANVFYELGMAHALKKEVVLITGDKIEEAPTDIKSFEFISYAKNSPGDFFESLDKALTSVIGNPYAVLYPEAAEVLEQFCAAKNRKIVQASEEEFAAAMSAVYSSGQRLPKQQRARAEFLARRLLGVEPEIELLIDLKDWLETAFP